MHASTIHHRFSSSPQKFLKHTDDLSDGIPYSLGREEDEDEDDSPDEGEDEEDHSDINQVIDNHRKRIMNYVSKKKEGSNELMTNDFKFEVEQCLLGGRDHPTLLHHIIIYINVNSSEKHELDKFEPLLRHAITRDRGLLKVPTSKTGETALHLATDKKMERTAKLMCKVLDEVQDPKNSLGSAICCQKEDGETCLHIAIKQELGGLVKYFIDNADSKTFKLKRISKKEEGPKNVENTAGNTPLHEAAHFLRCKESFQLCKRNCKQCEGKSPQPRPTSDVPLCRESHLEIIEKLVERCPEALRELNEAKQSPYQYHLLTRQQASKNKLLEDPGSKNTEARILKNYRIPESSSMLAQESGIAENKFNKELEGQKEDVKTNGIDSLEEILKAHRMNNPEKVSLRDKSGKGNKGPKGERKRRGNASEEVANKVEQYLKEYILTHNSFEEAVNCLFEPASEKSRIYFSLLHSRTPISTHTPNYYSFLKFRSTLACVELSVSPLQKQPQDKETTYYHADERALSLKSSNDPREKDAQKYLGEIFSWLTKIKRVKNILKVVIKDNQSRPCSDEAIERMLSQFDVRYLNWNKIDMCCETISKAAPKVVELWLYSSGNNAVLWSWSDEGGLKTLKKLKKVHLRVEQGFETYDRTCRNIENFQARVKKICQDVHINIAKPQKPNKRGLYWPRSQLDVEIAQEERHRWLESATNFAEVVRNAVDGCKESLDDIKIALIDDGVDVDDGELCDRIVEGWPPDQPGQFGNWPSPYYSSSEGHGTKMAALICKVCPLANLYVAKLDYKKAGGAFTAKCAAEAVEWAIEKGVHIINMSWSIEKESDNREHIKKLSTAIEKAAGKDIIMYCTARDQGLDVAKKDGPYPAASDTKKIKRVGGALRGGDGSTWNHEGAVDYLFPGVFGDYNGSSAATALATGLAALILLCFEVRQKGSAKSWSPDRMDTLFRTLAQGLHKYVSISELLQPSLKLKDEKDAVRRVVEECNRWAPLTRN
ncbi:MAG: hypothetical protein M1834_000014 [Cirrosporium novae-zelandiae]|nr:MAG: hypothetical protein M1834_000014 [Cirrosporium novae-zelandiae]